jgi:flagellar hook-basal body complex protein FliE
MAIDLLIGGASTLASAAPRLESGVRGASSAASAGGAAGVTAGFSQLLEGVETTAAQANEAVSAMVDKTGDVHDAMIALQRAEMALELTIQIRNKFVQAYQDIMRMPI